MIATRDKSLKRLGASLAGLALYIQLAVTGWALMTPGETADGLGGHALCLAGGAVTSTPTPIAPADDAPVAPPHDHASLCCLWHPLPGVTAQAALTPQPVAYARLAQSEPGDATFIPGPQRGPANARAPPTLA